MIRVIKYGQKRRVTCRHCGALLEFEKNDLEGVRTGIGEFEQRIVCPVCDEAVTVNSLEF